MNEILDYKNNLENKYDIKIFTDNVEFECLQQTEQLLQQETFKDCKIRLMPDTHAGKGAVIAKKDEKVIIPMNMRDGSLICIGKGNEDWNNSAPHGAGRIMSRSKAKDNINMSEYINSMEGIYTTSVNQSTIDEAPQVYKPMQEIIDNIQDTVEIVKQIKPIYNFKASL